MDWIDPNSVDNLEKLERSRYVAVTGAVAHKIMQTTAGHTDGLERIDDRDWELFTYHQINDRFIWGMFVEGFGFINVMVPREQVRDLTDAEKAIFSGRQYGIYGSQSGNLSYTVALPTLE